MKRQKFLAQNVIEFSFVFIILLSVFLSIIELALYWRSCFCVSNIANELMANVQVKAQNSSSESEIAKYALSVLEKKAGLLNLSGSSFVVSGSNSVYKISSTFIKNSSPTLVAILNINDVKRNDINVGVSYLYTGIFLFKQGRVISSGAVQSVQKF